MPPPIFRQDATDPTFPSEAGNAQECEIFVVSRGRQVDWRLELAALDGGHRLCSHGERGRVPERGQLFR